MKALRRLDNVLNEELEDRILSNVKVKYAENHPYRIWWGKYFIALGISFLVILLIAVQTGINTTCSNEIVFDFLGAPPIIQYSPDGLEGVSIYPRQANCIILDRI